MNYQHAYHAGNFADVFKHLVLTALIRALQNKPAPFCYIDTHAGSGRYDLLSEAAQKGKEYENGIKKILEKKDYPVLIQEYLNIVKKENEEWYPGSPLIVKQLLRSQDRMILSELKPEEYRALKKLFNNDKQTAVHHQDGYQGLKAFLPPKEKRGIILIDPPYEKDEFSSLLIKLPEAVRRFENGVFALWYPIKDKRITDRFIQTLQTKIYNDSLVLELMITKHPLLTHLNGCGMLVINPPLAIRKKSSYQYSMVAQ